MRSGIARAIAGMFAACACALAGATPATAGVARFEGIGMLPGASDSRAHAVSGDGCGVLGESGGRAFVRVATMREPSPSTGMVGHVSLASSYSGGRVHGVGVDMRFGLPRPLRLWVESGGVGLINYRDIDDPRMRWESSAEGRTTVGTGRLLEGVETRALVIHRGGVRALPGLPGGVAAGANGVSPDGLVVVGWAEDASGFRHAVRWDGDVLTQLGKPEADESEAFTTSFDGSVVFGVSGGEAFRWESGVMTPIGSFEPRDASALGTVVAAGPVVWDPLHGARPVGSLLSANGIDVDTWQDLEATGVSESGRTLVGVGRNPAGQQEAWVAHLGEGADLPPPPSHPDVIVDAGCDGTRPFEYPYEVALRPDGVLGMIAFDQRDDSQRFVRVETDGSTSVIEDVGQLGMIVPGPHGSFYVSDQARVLKISATGSASVAVDLSRIPPDAYVPTYVNDLDTAPDGTLCVAAANAVARVAPAGAVRVVTAAELHALRPEDPKPTLDAVVASDHGTCFAANGGMPVTLFGIDAGGPPRVAATDPNWNFDSVWHMARSPGGDIYLHSQLDQIGVLGPRGIQVVFAGIAVGAAGQSPFGVRRFEVAPDGSLLLLILSDTRYGIHRIVPPFVDEVATAVPVAESDGIREEPGRFTSAPDGIAAIWGGDIVHLPIDYGVPACANGVDDDGDGRVDHPADPGCTSSEDESEHQAAVGCDNGFDDDGDGSIDGDDPGCFVPNSPFEDPECSDGLDNDGDGRVDHDGAGGIPDPECAGEPWPNREGSACGLGYELSLLVLIGPWLRRRAPAG